MRGLPKFEDPNLIVGAENFSDAGVYRVADDLYIVQTLDFFPPLVDDPFVFGQIAAANSLSDVYAMGARPITAMNIVAFPDDRLELGVLGEILRGGAERVQAAGAVIVGGHSVRDTEIKYGLSATGVVSPDKLLTNSHAQPGDAMVLTKALGTGFITTAFKAKNCPADVLDAAVASMIQLNAIGRDAAHAAGAHAMTDVTGFGLAGHAVEMGQASGITIHLEVGKLPLLPGAMELLQRGHKTRASACNRSFSQTVTRVNAAADPLRMEFAFDAQTSGGLLVAVPKDRAQQLVEQAQEQGAKAACIIGWVTQREEAAVVLRA